MEEIFEANKDMLKSMLLDEERLITYVSLSKDLCVHVNISKLLLLRLVDSVRQEKPDLQLNVIYVVSGAVENNNARTIICSEYDLEKHEKCFKNIFYKHIYSVNKGLPHIDTAAYLIVNKFEDFTLCSGLIRSKDCDKLTSVEIDNFKSYSQDIVVPEKTKSLPSKKSKPEANGLLKNGSTDIKLISKDKESKSEPVIKKEVRSPSKEAIGNNTQPKPSHSQKSQKGIAGFFNKPKNSNTKKEITPKVDNGNEGKVTIKAEKMDIADQSPIKVKVEEQDKKKNKINNNLNQIKKNSKVDKKRKRVLHVSDSESDNENNDPFIDSSVTEQEAVPYGSDDEIPPTPTVNNVKITSGILNPKKRRKVVDKTYTDEDGYILTKKEEVYESCSENEDEIKSQESPPKAKQQIKIEISPKGKSGGPKKKVSPPQKGKQSTLTNFFKKV